LADPDELVDSPAKLAARAGARHNHATAIAPWEDGVLAEVIEAGMEPILIDPMLISIFL